MSGKLLLMYCIDEHQKHCTGWEWNETICDAIKASKNNIITKENNHNGSVGHYYSYGNRGNFGMVDGSSVGQYTYKCFNSEFKTMSSHIKDTAVQHICSHELGAGIDSLATRLPNIKRLISPIVDAAYTIQELKGGINLKKLESTYHGVWQSSVCVNSSTERFHTEDDCTSTVIVVPKQVKMKNEKKVYRFIFQLKKHLNISFKLKYGVSFMFSGKCLTHRQQCSHPIQEKNDLFFNIAAYGNKRLYSHINKSFQRKAHN